MSVKPKLAIASESQCLFMIFCSISFRFPAVLILQLRVRKGAKNLAVKNSPPDEIRLDIKFKKSLNL